VPEESGPKSPKSSLNCRIKVAGLLDEKWSSWFSDMRIQVEKDDKEKEYSIISGIVKDQAALFGLINKIRDLGLSLFSIQVMPVFPE
jgi:hypothetical protein